MIETWLRSWYSLPVQRKNFYVNLFNLWKIKTPNRLFQAQEGFIRGRWNLGFACSDSHEDPKTESACLQGQEVLHQLFKDR